MRLAKRRNLQKGGDAAAAGNIRLHHVHGTRIHHATKIEDVVAVLACRNFDLSRCSIANQPQTFEIVGRNRLFEPGHAGVDEVLCLIKGLLAAVRAVRIYVEFSIRADRFSGHAYTLQIFISVPPDLHLYARNVLLHPAAKLLRELLV